MHIGKSYKLSEFLIWTRHSILWLFILGLIPIILYDVLDLKWVAISWTVVAMLGTATVFILQFKNTQTYNRTYEANQIWGAIISSSRVWTLMCRDFISNADRSKELIYRHLAWLTALRYQLRDNRVWETVNKKHNSEYRKYYTIPEAETPLKKELEKYLSPEELKNLPDQNSATYLATLQSTALKNSHNEGMMDNFRFMEIHRRLAAFMEQQSRTERIKNFPYPRQYATINKFFLKLFCILLPFALLKEFDKLNDVVTGFLQGKMVWFVLPFSMLVSWVYTSLEQVGESTENPFEGGSNDVPISQLSRDVEIDMRTMLGETDLPPAVVPRNNIVL